MTSIQQPDIVLRPPTLKDLPAIVALLNACAQEWLGTSPYSTDLLRLNWKQSGFDYTNDARLALDDGQVVGYGSISPTGPHGKYELTSYTHPTQQGRGIGTALMQWGETRVRSRAQPGMGVLVRCKHYDTSEESKHLLLDRGYHYVRSFYEMKIEMTSAPPAPVWPSAISVRGMVAGQEEARVFRANEEAFRSDTANLDKQIDDRFSKWQQWVRTVPEYDPGFFFIAWDGAEIAGVALCFPKDLDFPNMAWLHSLSVRRPWRRRGLGLALLQHAFRQCYRRDIRKLVLTVDSANPTRATQLYEKAGMSVFLQWHTYEKELRPEENWTSEGI